MKKTVACLAAIMTLVSLTACSDTAKNDHTITENNLSAAAHDTVCDTVIETPVSEYSSEVIENDTDNTSNYLSGELENANNEPLNSSDYVLDASYTPLYDNITYLNNPSSGEPCSYEELQDFMESYGDTSFVEYEILSQYTPEEAFAKTGDKIFINNTTLYKARIYYDYLNDVPVDITIDLSKAGVSNRQIKDKPPYSIGQKIISPLSGFNTSRCVAIPELVYYVYEVNGVKLAYHVGSENVAIKNSTLVNLDMELIESERSVITTTVENPVKFTQKSTVDDLAQFIKNDWNARGYNFFDVSSVNGNTLLEATYNENEMAVE